MNHQHIEKSLGKIRPFFEKVSSRIEDLKPGEKVPATKLAEDVAKEIGMTMPQLYPTLKFLFEDYPGVAVLKGAHGGIYKLLPGESLDANGKVIKATVVKDGNQ